MSIPLDKLITPLHLEYTIIPGQSRSRFLKAIREGRIVGQRCIECHKVYIPMHGACPTCGVPTVEEVELSHVGTITMFCVVNIPFDGMYVDIPFVAASILLDGADVPFFHLIQGIPIEQVRLGLRVKAVWCDPSERSANLESIRYFTPTGEPDAPFEQYKEYV